MDAISTAAQDALRYEKTNWANGSVFEQEFYQVPAQADDNKEPPGAPLKVEHETDTSKYLLPPMTSMSRFIYQSENLLGLPVPASAAILWPYSPKRHTDGKYPVVAWAHGTSGIFAENAPSNHRSLWQHFLAPYQLVSAGYVVVMPDYAGLGVSKTAKGEKIVHQYLACPAHANDVAYAVQAAQSVWKDELSKDWVVIGHSQGGGAAWAVAERQARNPVDGYLGAVAVSPFTRLYGLEDPFCSVLALAMTPGWVDWDKEENLSNLVTEEGRKRLKIIEEIGAGTSASLPLLLAEGLLKPGWQSNRAFRNFLEEVENGGKEIGGPLLVIHGETDERLCIDATANAVANTAQDWPESRLEFIRLPGVSHVPALQAGQRVWMDWIADRFAGRDVKQGVTTMTLKTARPGRSYQKEHNWYLEAATEPFHAP
ncbi:MAG: hypothetical protein L6R38_007308 [Xanthoria sp. 2 TBL-2021]|nr:MAG: hypothetical protein L6R38_007308 [Xanthoria sp. 2 TBL-2021]